MLPTKPSLRLCAFSLTVLLASCGGGDSGNVTPPPPVVAVTVQITAPGALDNVFTAGTPVAVRASAAVNGVAVADGTVVRFSTPSGTFSPVAPGSRAGVAATTLTSSATGPLQINATVAETDRAGTATQTIYQRPTPARMEILVPAYFYPSTRSAWNTLTTSAAARLLLESYRGDSVFVLGGLRAAQLAALGVLILGLWLVGRWARAGLVHAQAEDLWETTG